MYARLIKMEPTIKTEEPIIEDVNLTFKNEVKNRYLKHIIAFVLVYPILFYFLFPYVIFETGLESWAAMIILFGSLILWAMFLGGLKEEILVKFYQQFASMNKYNFTHSDINIVEDGVLFREGRDRIKLNIISGKFKNHSIALFNYSFTVGQRKSQHTYFYTVFEIDYDKRIPRMFLRSDRYKLLMFKPDFQNGRRLRLEGDFDKHFDLFVEEKFEIEALQIFTPDIMHKLMTDWSKFTLEFTNDKIYIYIVDKISKKEDIQSMYNLAKYLIDRLAPIISNMESSTTAMQERFSTK